MLTLYHRLLPDFHTLRFTEVVFVTRVTFVVYYCFGGRRSLRLPRELLELPFVTSAEEVENLFPTVVHVPL